MASHLWGDLLGAEIAVREWPKSPKGVLALWTGVLGGPVAWTLQLLVSYPVASLSCLPQYRSEHPFLLNAMTFGALAFVAFSAWLAWAAFRRPADGASIEGGKPWDRARFMGLLGLLTSLFFVAVIVATAMPAWILRGVCN